MGVIGLHTGPVKMFSWNTLYRFEYKDGIIEIIDEQGFANVAKYLHLDKPDEYLETKTTIVGVKLGNKVFQKLDCGFDNTMHAMVYKYKELNDITPMALMTGVINIENRYHSILIEDTNDILLTKYYVQFNEKEIAL